MLMENNLFGISIIFFFKYYFLHFTLIDSLFDRWQRDLQPLASRVPYMVTVGNHETLSLWLAFLKRFDMPAVER